MAGRKVPNEVQKTFDKYTENFVRRLNKEKSLVMFQKEFGLSEDRASFMFGFFDQDHNEQLSIWEFSHFYTAFGNEANQYLDEFDRLTKEGDGCLGKADISGTWDFLKQLKTLSGRCMKDEELMTMIKGKAGEEKSINMHKFTELVCRIKMTRTRD